jgi:hypothetical protein
MFGQDGLPSVSDAKLFTITVSPTITAAAYTAGKALGGKLTLANAVRYTGGPAKLKSIVIADKAGQKSAIDVLLFNQDFTPTADAASIAISAADLLNMAGAVSLVAGDYVDVATGRSLATKDVSYELCVSASGGTSLFAQLVCRGTPTYASTSDIQVRLVFERE